jgi:acyl transferase domain-containing protein
MACRLPGAESIDEYWANLVGEVESIVHGPSPGSEDGAASAGSRFVSSVGKVHDVEYFDADYFRIPPSEAVTMDPQHRVLLELAVTALEDAGYAGNHDEAVGVFVGSGINHYFNRFVAPHQAFEQDRVDERAVLGNEKDFLASRIAFKLGLTGPSVSIQTACSTSLTAVVLACQALAAGDCDIALAGGVSLLMPDIDGYTYEQGGVLSSDGYCCAFDERASGTVPASGAGLVVLKLDSAAVADRDHRRATIRGWAVNNDGASRAGFSAPGVAGQAAVVRRALARSGLVPRDVGYIETHGTGTLIGDPVEIEALRAAFGTDHGGLHSCAIGSVKPSIGHTDAAAGIAGLIKATLAVESGTIPASIQFRNLNPEIDLDQTPFFVADATTPWPSSHVPRVAGVSSFGIGGTNAHVVIESAPPDEPGPAERPRQILALSARSDDALRATMTRLAQWLEMHDTRPACGLADVGFSLVTGRPLFPARWASAFANTPEAIASLRQEIPPAHPIARWSLAIEGTPGELAALARRFARVDDHLVRGALASLMPAVGSGTNVGELGAMLDSLPDATAGSLAAIVCADALQVLGVTFARIDGPDWMSPVLRWLDRAGALDELPNALAACERTGDGNARRIGRGTLVAGRDFDLADATAELWAAGTDIDWSRYYDLGARRRVSLPTYVFERQRFWLDGRSRSSVLPLETPATSDATGTDVGDVVAAVWAEVLGHDKVDRDAHFVDDLDGDSIFAAEIGTRLSAHFGVDLPIDLPFVAPTITAATTAIEQARLPEAAR